MTRSLKILSLLLSYPSLELQQAAPEMARIVADDTQLGEENRRSLLELIDDVAKGDLTDLQERYVFLFDRTRTLSLHLFEHVHGESRDRGQAMVDLMATYDAAGFEIGARELPDYLPLFLEFLSMCPQEEAADLLGQTVHILAALKERLEKRGSIYRNAFAVMEAMASGTPDRALLDELRDAPQDDPNDLQALDAIWQEEAITFGGNAGEGACGPDRLQRRIRASKRDAASDMSPDVGHVA
ncbi:nitrate reductase molybdenum cofactor assembly chaperone [Breoghania corrubedonensis]|nr:nitrate reductase molybdenum cofactor assembly chaperone [Breoghania corrubedonensis]